MMSPKLPKIPKPPPAPPSLGDENIVNIGKFLKLQGRLGGMASTIRGGAAISAAGSRPATGPIGLVGTDPNKAA